MRKLKNDELNRLDLKEYKTKEKHPVFIVLDNLRSAHNVGSIFRTCDAFLIEKICLCGITPYPPKKEIRKTALGATQSVDWQYYKDTSSCLKELKANDVRIVSIEQAENATQLQYAEIEYNQKTALVFGHEVSGVSQDCINLSDEVIEIPQHGTKHSFNVTVSLGIVLWQLMSK